jgi:hypothetical protein
LVLLPNVPHHDRCHFTKDVTAITSTEDSCLEFVNSRQLIGGHYSRGFLFAQEDCFIREILAFKFSPILTFVLIIGYF